MVRLVVVGDINSLIFMDALQKVTSDVGISMNDIIVMSPEEALYAFPSEIKFGEILKHLSEIDFPDMKCDNMFIAWESHTTWREWRNPFTRSNYSLAMHPFFYGQSYRT